MISYHQILKTKYFMHFLSLLRVTRSAHQILDFVTLIMFVENYNS